MQIRLDIPWKSIIGIALAALLLANCARQPIPSPEPVSSPTIPAQPIVLEQTATPEPTQDGKTSDLASPTPTQQSPARNTQYSLNSVLNYAEHTVEVEERIQYVNHSYESITELLLVVEPVYYPGVFELKTLTWDDGQAIQSYRWDGSFLIFPLQKPLESAQDIALNITYQLRLPSPTPSAETRPVPFGYTTRQANLVDWYPYLPPYQSGKGWLAHRAGFFGEHQVYESADFTVTIRITDQRSDLMIAASAPDEGTADIHQYHLNDARNFVWSVSPEYTLKTKQVGDVTILGYSFGFHEIAGEAALQTTAEALELYSRLFGDYPRNQLSVVEADFLDGMEYEGLYFLSNGFYNLYQGTPAEYLVAIAAHETAHQWWYALVGNDQALEPWLDEAFCTYSERIYYENLHPEALDWWWTYRVNYYEPKGWVDGSIYNPDGYRAYRDAIYLNGVLFLEDLRNLIGNEAFMASLKDYARQYAHQIATTADFFNVVGEHTSLDLAPLKKKYFSQP
jgi:hypothetical protein